MLLLWWSSSALFFVVVFVVVVVVVVIALVFVVVFVVVVLVVIAVVVVVVVVVVIVIVLLLLLLRGRACAWANCCMVADSDCATQVLRRPHAARRGGAVRPVRNLLSVASLPLFAESNAGVATVHNTALHY